MSSSTGATSWINVKQMIAQNCVSILIVAPEALFFNTGLRFFLADVGVGLTICDEGHVYDEWRAWRPTLGVAVSMVPSARRLALSATV